ncbi:GGDEF domain-containing protein [Sphingomonas jatrophae]|uniref:diguanylate cyclase n=1 Tax=Sphingomonas jatrophae TaxID=1166337 RepID=A0A1I6M806_9SPHN|nr:sensor domain-containing diguanylate cyclase [Sphingomonas jatrophae]SFS11875.1 diguanylate cyclase with GAF sensor [Sphingomonas jatrophae]
MSELVIDDEDARLAALRRLDVLDTPAEEPFEKIVNLVQTVLGVPMATVTLVDQDRQWFKAHRGLDAQETPRSISFCTHAIRQREPLVVPDALADERFAASPLVTGEPFIRSYAGVPLRTPEGYNVGALCALDTKPRRFSAAELAIMGNLASIVCDELQLRLIAQRDHLTHTLTRRGFVEQAEKEIAKCRRYGRPASLALLDIDHFKSINDTYGHGGGDVVLRQLAEICAANMRPSDAMGRIGGEEFALLMPETGAAEALAAAERFRAIIEAHEFELEGGRLLKVTASFGVAAYTPDLADTTAWLAQTDLALYRAKREGRNRCRLEPAPEERSAA